jgi:hypothetical protein
VKDGKTEGDRPDNKGESGNKFILGRAGHFLASCFGQRLREATPKIGWRRGCLDARKIHGRGSPKVLKRTSSLPKAAS